ncbi:MAG: hypothetical protein AB7O26_21055 [Planctomycetaceae bacterium]
MSRPEASIRSRLDASATAAIAVWSVVAVAVLVATVWHAAFSDADSISWFALCVGTTLGAGLNLFADGKFHQSSLARGGDGNGSLPAFLVTSLPPFIPAAVLSSDPSVFAVGYLAVLFAFVSLVAWSIGERRDYLRLAELYRFAPSARAEVKTTPLPAVSQPAPPAFESTAKLAKPSIVILPQPRPAKPTVPMNSAEHREPPKPAHTIASAETPTVARSSPIVEKPQLREQPAKKPAAPDPATEPKVSQWIKRCLDDGGKERIEGSARIEFASGQKQATLHVPFVPALPAIPQVEAHVLDGAPVRLKIGFAQAFGVRIEARRSDSAQSPLVVDIGFTAVPTGRRTSAA